MRAKESQKRDDEKEKAFLFLTVMTIMVRDYTGQAGLLIRMNKRLNLFVREYLHICISI
jgi:hypothetical protein